MAVGFHYPVFCQRLSFKGRACGQLDAINQKQNEITECDWGLFLVPKKSLPTVFWLFKNQKRKTGGENIMKSYRKELWFNINARRGFVNITGQVDQCLKESGVSEGLILVNAMHITASVFINDDESGLHQDYEEWLEKLAPHEPVSQYQAQPDR